jgi:hypothetical protein
VSWGCVGNVTCSGGSRAVEELLYQGHVTYKGEVQGGAPAVPTLQCDVVGEQLRLVQRRIELVFRYYVVVVPNAEVKGTAKI